MFSEDDNELLTPQPLDENGERIIPPVVELQELPSLPSPVVTALSSVWDSDKVEKLPNGWCCHHCNNSWRGVNHTKALNHVLKRGQDIKPCKAVIPESYRQAYQTLYDYKSDRAESRSTSAASMGANLHQTDARTMSLLGTTGHRKRLATVDLTSPITTTSHSTKSSVTSKASLFFKKQKSASNMPLLQTTLQGANTKTSKSAAIEANVALAHWVLANNYAHNTLDDPLFARALMKVQMCGSDYRPPKRYDIGGALLDATYESYYSEQVQLLLQDADVYGISVYGDGATINTTPKINIMASSPGNPACVLDVVDCTDHITEGGTKNAKYIAMETLKALRKLPSGMQHVVQISFDGASNVQKGAEIMRQFCPQASVEHGAEHVVSLIVDKLVKLPAFSHCSKFSKIVRVPLFKSIRH